MKFIQKLFIKNYRNTSDPKVHIAYGVVAGIIGIVLNFFLSTVGIIIGVFTSSITIIVEGVGTLTDALSSIITLIGFKLSSKPADKEHPYGHARIEYICGLIITIIMFAVGLLFTKTCIEKIIHPESIIINFYTYLILVLIIVTKLFLMLMYRSFAKAISSDTLLATSVDSRDDMIAGIATLVSMIVMHVTGINIDGYIGLLVSLFVIYAAIKMIKETIDPLISVKPSKNLVSKVKRELLSFDGINDMHDLLIHTYGSGSTFATVHVEVPASTTLLNIHELVDKIERHFEDDLNINLTIQIDPVDKDNKQTLAILEKITNALKELHSGLTVHSLRVIYNAGTTRVLFDILQPFGSNLTKAEISEYLQKIFADEPTKFEFIFTIDRPFT